jgi:hypothetical protein
VYAVGELDVFVFERCEEQLAFTDPISEETVLSSPSTLKIELVFSEWNCATCSGPPGRDVLSGEPYCTVEFALEKKVNMRKIS